MASKLLPASLMAGLTVISLIVLLFLLRSGLRFTGWSDTKKKSFFRRSVLFIVCWFLFLTFISATGLSYDFSTLPPRPLIPVLAAMAGALLFSFNRSFSQLLKATPAYGLVVFQSFRIIVEIILWMLHERNLVPVQMSWEGLNFDVFSGLLAIPAAWIMNRYPEKGGLAGFLYNIAGLVLLFNIIAISILSLPTPIRYFHNEPANTIVGTFPFYYLPSILVVLAFAGHVFSLRQLFLQRKGVSGEGERTKADRPAPDRHTLA